MLLEPLQEPLCIGGGDEIGMYTQISRKSWKLSSMNESSSSNTCIYSGKIVMEYQRDIPAYHFLTKYHWFHAARGHGGPCVSDGCHTF